MSRLLSMARPSGVGALLLAVLGAALLGTPDVLAQDGAPISWQHTGRRGDFNRIFTPTSGALFARGRYGHRNPNLARSDDGGTSWRPVSGPPADPAGYEVETVVDPIDHTRIYMATTDGLYKTSDDAASWQKIRETETNGEKVIGLAISPADPSLVYLALRGPDASRFQFLRSIDGGATWETLEDRAQETTFQCTWGVSLLQPHPTDPDRVFRAAACSTNAEQAVLQQSRDRGVTWTDVYAPKLALPHRLAFGGAERPGRLVLGLNKDARGGGSLLARSDDDGATWTTILEHTGGGSMSGGGPNVVVGGLAIDPSDADHLLAGFYARGYAQEYAGQVLQSHDGGGTWTDVTRGGMHMIQDVAFGIDGRNVYLVDRLGVWRAVAP